MLILDFIAQYERCGQYRFVNICFSKSIWTILCNIVVYIVQHKFTCNTFWEY